MARVVDLVSVTQLLTSLTLTKLLSPRAVTALVVALSLICLVLLAELVWQVAALYRQPTLPLASDAVVREAPSQQRAAYDLQALLAVPLFGVRPGIAGEIAAGSAPGSAEDVKVSALKIKVLGLVSGGENAGIAVLQHGSKTRAYAVGEKIEVPGDVQLLAVRGDHILIENNRRREKIELDKRVGVAGVSSSAPAADEQQVNVDRPEIRELIGDPRDTVQNSPLKLARFFSVSPVMEDGQLQGYALSPGRDKRLFELLEIQSGDVLLSVNGQSLADVSTPELLKMMEDTSSFELLVKRNDSILTKRLDL